VTQIPIPSVTATAAGPRASSGFSLIGRQSLAMLLDAYRELSARKLFWLSMMLSGIVVIAFAVIGINENGVTLLGYEVGLPFSNTKRIAPATFYKLVFQSLGVQIWLTWAATILALVSTAGMIPEFIASGAIETTLSKPISRLRLFLTKYLTSLLFVALQVTVFTFCSFMVIGFRGGSWEFGLFLAIPIVLTVFSYLYCICALLGLITRSAIAALLLTVLVWFSIFIVDAAEKNLLLFRSGYDIAVKMHDEQIAKLQTRLEAAKKEAENPTPPAPPKDSGLTPGQEAATKNVVNNLLGGLTRKPKDPAAASPAAKQTAPAATTTTPAVAPPAPTDADASEEPIERQSRSAREAARATRAADKAATPEEISAQIAEWQTARKGSAETAASLATWHIGVLALKTALPKTGESAELLSRGLFKSDELSQWRDSASENGGGPPINIGKVRVPPRRAARAMEEALKSRSTLWIVGTSMAFQVTILGIACIIFTRRDF
jgi:ABC-type transport system involved in multi-copper enzyme maturation permease subunit